MARFEADRYRIPTGSAGSKLALSRSLISAGDKDAAPQVKKALKKVHAAALTAQDAWKRMDAVASTDAREADNVIDNAHAATEIRLQTYAWLASELDADDVEQAKEIHAKLYGQGMSFLKLPFAEEWAESEKRLQRITEEGLRPALERLVGKPFIEALFSAHTKYGVALGITKADAGPGPTGIANELKALDAAINQYVRVVAGTVDDDDDATIDAAIAMLRPVDVYRSRMLAGRGAGGGDAVPTEPADPTAPVPVAPTGGAPAPEAPSAPIPPVK